MGQMFRTLPVGMGVLPCLYQLSIRAPGPSAVDIATYTFPLSPTQIRQDRSSLSTFTDVQGPPSSQGVTRVMDTYGLAPPVFTIEGTTGWDYHSADGYILTGTQSIQLLQKFLAQYATLNQQQRAAGNPQFFGLEFYDYFTTSFWQIEPIGPQIFRQSADKPTLIYYRLRWAAVAPAGVPILGEIDALAGLLGVPAAQAAINAAQTLGAFLFSYSPAGVL
jgi:hypothetical protein